MRALLFKDFGSVAVEDVPKPTIEEPTDVLVRVTHTAICGSDLHILHGRIPGMTEGSVLGHEFVGVIEECGSGVSRFHDGDRVVGSFVIPCGVCWYCTRREFSRCPDQRVFGYGSFYGDINGAQAEYVRVPSADVCLHALPDALTNERALFAGDIFTTGLDVASSAHVTQGDVVAVQGCGPVGLMAVQAAKTFGAERIYAIDSIPSRLEMAQRFGAIPVNAESVHVPSFIQDETDGRGADALLECVGAIPAFLAALDIVRPGGRIAVIGVYSEMEIELPLNITWVKGIDIKMCGVANIPGHWDDALRLIESGAAQPSDIISHRLPLDDAVRGYELFESREALKVVLTP